MMMKAFKSRATHRIDLYTSFYMHEVSRKKFPLHEHYQTTRTSDGIATDCKIRMKEAMLLDGQQDCKIRMKEAMLLDGQQESTAPSSARRATAVRACRARHPDVCR